jgi:hypothetical protein
VALITSRALAARYLEAWAHGLRSGRIGNRTGSAGHALRQPPPEPTSSRIPERPSGAGKVAGLHGIAPAPEATLVCPTAPAQNTGLAAGIEPSSARTYSAIGAPGPSSAGTLAGDRTSAAGCCRAGVRWRRGVAALTFWDASATITDTRVVIPMGSGHSCWPRAYR